MQFQIQGSVVEQANPPTAVAVAEPAFGVIGSVVKLDGRQSSDVDNKPLTYSWKFVSVPIGSKTGAEGFRRLDEDGSLVSFSPDMVGEYTVSLTVSNGAYESEPVAQNVSIRAILVPHGRGLVPDGKFIWSYLRDVWRDVEDKEFFETLWSALIQLVGAEMLKLYQVDFNKSIRDIQDRFQRRWVPYEPRLSLKDADTSFFLGNSAAGTTASTERLGLEGEAIVLSEYDLIVTSGTVLSSVIGEDVEITFSRSLVNRGHHVIENVNASKTGYILRDPLPNPNAERVYSQIPVFFDTGSAYWNLLGSGSFDYASAMSVEGSPVLQLSPIYLGENSEEGAGTLAVGDVFVFKAGPNAGSYRIVNKSGSFIQVDKAPPSFSDTGTVSTYAVDVYRPVGIEVSQPDVAVQNTFSVPYTEEVANLSPGRVIVVGGQAFTVVRVTVDTTYRVPLAIITLDGGTLPTGFLSLPWRVAHTLVSKKVNFEEQGVSPGDVLLVHVTTDGGGTLAEMPLQVVGVDRNRLAFVISTEPVVAGQVPQPTDSSLHALATGLSIPGTALTPYGLTMAQDAAALWEALHTPLFQRTYHNRELTQDTPIEVGGYTFFLHPHAIIRNKRIPVDETLLSVPLLQEYVRQPETAQRDGKLFYKSGSKEFPLERAPIVLSENSDYLVDGEYAFDGSLTFNTGTDLIEVDDGDFIDRSVRPGDTFIVDAPITMAGNYIIQEVLSNSLLRLSRPIPLYVLSKRVTARVRLQRKQKGHFLRFVPGTFSASNPAPERLWAEVSFYDNSDTVEANFGILVGLTKEALEGVSTQVNYRQAVAGLMYAFTRGSAVERVRLGVHILLGLPFAEHRGIIRSIEEDYRLDVNGKPVLGRFLVEDVDSHGNTLGTMRVYTYPLDADSALAGVETNPATKLPYAVGDTVELFASLCKGVEVVDYLMQEAGSDPKRLLQQFHSIRVRANDNVFSLRELSLVSNFLQRITPSYLAYFISVMSEVADDVEVRDTFRGSLASPSGSGILTDHVAARFPSVLSYGTTNPSGISQAFWDDGLFAVRRAGRDGETLAGQPVLRVAAGGFLTLRSGEAFIGPLARPGDRVLLTNGPNAGTYTVGSVTDTELTLSDAPGFEAATGLRYVLLRPATDVRWQGSAIMDGSGAVTATGSSLRSDLVSPGTWFLDETNGKRYTILRVGPASAQDGYPELDPDQMIVIPTPPSATVTGCVVDPKYLKGRSSETYTVTGDGTNIAPLPPSLRARTEIGDELRIEEDVGRRYLVLDPVHGYVTPPLPAGTYQVTLCKRGRGEGRTTFDHYDSQGIESVVDVRLKGIGATTASGSENVTLPVNASTLGVVPGDLFVLTSGPDASVEVGYGPGVYPLARVNASTLMLTVNMTATGTSAWEIRRRR